MTTATPDRVQITLPPLHKNQQIIAKHPARFKVVCCGRRWGKTLLAMTLCMRDALKGKRIWHVAPTYKQTLEGWSYLQRLVQQLPQGIAKTHISELTVQFTGGGSIQLRTADNPDNLRGSGLDGVVIDEAATVKQEAWDLVLRPALADRQGWALFISTPQHFNWFWDLYQRGEDPEAHDWAAWQMPTWDNPYIAESEIEAAQRDMEPGDFDQEFGASFTAIGGAIFPLLSSNRPMYLRPMPEELVSQFRRTGVGMDWGTTLQHNSAVVCGSILPSGAVWIRSSWLDNSGSGEDWKDEAMRCKRDYGATFARVDRSQQSILDRLVGLESDKGVADVEARIGDVQGLVRRQAIFFDSRDEGCRMLYQHMCAYHRFPENHPSKAGKIDETEDDDVDALHYLVAELVGGVPSGNAPYATAIKYKSEQPRQPNESRLDAYRRQEQSKGTRIGGRA